jgi:hypothetical protein
MQYLPQNIRFLRKDCVVQTVTQPSPLFHQSPSDIYATHSKQRKALLVYAGGKGLPLEADAYPHPQQ